MRVINSVINLLPSVYSSKLSYSAAALIKTIGIKIELLQQIRFVRFKI